MASARSAPKDTERLVFYLGRVYYSYLGVLTRVLRDTGLDEHLRPGMGNVLFALFAEDGMTVSEICERIGVARSTMTGVVAKMADRGIVDLERDADDARAKRVWLTELGRSLEPRCREVTRRLDRIFGAGLSRADEARFRGYMADLLARLTAANSGDPPR